MNTAPAGFFSPDINNQDASSKLPNFPRDFVGTVRVAACKGITRRDGSRAFIAELEVVTSNMPKEVQVGSKYSWFQGLTETGTAYPACIAFLYACLQLDQTRDKAKIDKDVKPNQDAYLNRAVSEENILRGQLVTLQTSNIVTKKTKQDFTVHNFSPAPATATPTA